MKKIDISTKKYPNTFVLVDDDDYEYFSQWKWHPHTGYATRRVLIKGTKNPYKNEIILMHRLINNTPEGLQTDHINRNRLDNRRKNLRSVTSTQNQRNVGRRKDNISGIVGVRWYKRYNKWIVTIRALRKELHIGYFTNIVDAKIAREKVEKKYWL